MLSFTRAQAKHIFAKVTKIWWLYFALTAVILLAANVFLTQEIGASMERASEYQSEQKRLQSDIQDLDEYYERLSYEVALINQRIDKNDIRRDKIYDLLALIPDKITLHFIEIGESTLTLKGVTPSKEFFYFALQDPLKANFGRSNVSFYALSNGWYEFVSISNTPIAPQIAPKAQKAGASVGGAGGASSGGGAGGARDSSTDSDAGSSADSSDE